MGELREGAVATLATDLEYDGRSYLRARPHLRQFAWGERQPYTHSPQSQRDDHSLVSERAASLNWPCRCARAGPVRGASASDRRCFGCRWRHQRERSLARRRCCTISSAASSQPSPAGFARAMPQLHPDCAPAFSDCPRAPPAPLPLPPVAETAAPPVEETAAPPVEETAAPPVADTAAPPVEETPAPPVARAPPVAETPAPPVARAPPAAPVAPPEAAPPDAPVVPPAPAAPPAPEPPELAFRPPLPAPAPPAPPVAPAPPVPLAPPVLDPSGTIWKSRMMISTF